MCTCTINNHTCAWPYLRQNTNILFRVIGGHSADAVLVGADNPSNLAFTDWAATVCEQRANHTVSLTCTAGRRCCWRAAERICCVPCACSTRAPSLLPFVENDPLISYMRTIFFFRLVERRRVPFEGFESRHLFFFLWIFKYFFFLTHENEHTPASAHFSRCIDVL